MEILLKNTSESYVILEEKNLSSPVKGKTIYL